MITEKITFEKGYKDIMQKLLYDLSKEELIGIVQDYQEIVSDLEEILNELRTDNPHDASQIPNRVLKTKIREILYKDRNIQGE